IFRTATEDLRKAGATVIDPATVEGLEAIRKPTGIGPCMGFKYDINRYLGGLGDGAPVKTLADVIKSGRFFPPLRGRLEQAEQGPANGPDSPECKADTEYRQRVGEAVLKTMDS